RKRVVLGYQIEALKAAFVSEEEELQKIVGQENLAEEIMAGGRVEMGRLRGEDKTDTGKG
ncbi:MAG: hypothetical protein L6277_17990, partial [Desulfobacterales bacterium]|nr:hypothetical protein [Pseudomonadota bacterium]MCG2773963.1 hypothetical protein [Desulfobacterales bacterium]